MVTAKTHRTRFGTLPGKKHANYEGDRIMSKISFLLGAGVGYVLGTRAGEKRYEQIKKQADKAWHSPVVQEKVSAATDQVKAKGPAVAAAVGQKAATAATTGAKTAINKAGDAKDVVADKASDAKDTVTHHGDKDLPETIYRGDDGELHADTSGFGPGGEKLP